MILYAVLAAASWPTLRTHEAEALREPLPWWLPIAWAVVWVGGAVLQMLPGVAALLPGAVRTAGVLAGSLLAVTFWVVGQNLGELYSGQSTDPSSGPLLVLMAFAVLGSALPSAHPLRSHELTRVRPVTAVTS